MTGFNLPPGLSNNTFGAPWNEPEGECPKCGSINCTEHDENFWRCLDCKHLFE